eukprot:TRINITY_DN10921_c0_g1_i1.p1 TRINITY_DN10921_c0_g1~~TRINITY_DN10921_c0_g1_i1.p1  ORF type:complete len:106 (+),score=37.54 TRINITY_DN10921_c0_g1_i1:90-407(+)
MSAKCPRCGKSVYFAERQLYKGVDYHQTCVWALTKEEEANRGTPVFSVAEQMHCNPDDKKPWKGGYDGGQSGSGYVNPNKNSVDCNCGAALPAGSKFCSSCGNKL